VLKEIGELTGKEVDPVYGEPRPGDVLHSHASIEKARAELGYEPLVSFRDGLRRTIEHFAARAAAASPV
jgi:nucleoside-diphosphate-sugar epimerase